MIDSITIDPNLNAKMPHKGIWTETAEQLPSAASDWARDAWSHKGQFLLHSAETLGESALAGGVISYLMPCQGRAALALGAVLLAPLVLETGKKLIDVNEAAALPGADVHKLGHDLAYSAVDGSYNLALSFGGGYAGAELGGALGNSSTAAGDLSRSIRAKISTAFGDTTPTIGELTITSKDGLTSDSVSEPNARGGGGGRGGDSGRGAPPPVVDGPAGVLTSLEGVPRSEVTVAGSVSKLLADDTKGLPHQRFLVQLGDGTNVFIANDTHYGTAVPGLKVGSPIQLRGEWIPEPGNWDGTNTVGVLHWTHKGDAGSSHPGGWIDYGGQRYSLLGL